MQVQWTLTHPPTPSPLPASMLSDIISTSLRLYVSMDGRMEGWMYPSCTFTHFVMHVFIVCARRACIHMFTFTFMYADIYMNHRCTCLICIHYNGHFLCRFLYVYQAGYLLSPPHLQPSIPGLPRCFAAWGPSLGSCCATALPGRRSGVSVSVHRKCIRKRIMIVDRILCEYISLYMWIDCDEYKWI